MNLRDLTYFEIIATTSHIGRAAEQIGRTQPALTKCVQRLEDELGAKLFVKDGRGIKLTPVGEVLLERARALRETADNYARDVMDFAIGNAGRIRVGTGATTAEYLLPAICDVLWRERPGLKIEVHVGLNDVLRTMLANNQLDVAMGPLLGSDESNFAIMELGTDEVVVAARPNHPLFSSPLCLKSMLNYGWVLPASSVALRQWIDAAFDDAGLSRPKIQIETNVLSLLFSLISHTDLLIFASRHNLTRRAGSDKLCELQLPETTMKRRLGIVYQRSGYISPATKTFLDTAISVAKKILAS